MQARPAWHVLSAVGLYRTRRVTAQVTDGRFDLVSEDPQAALSLTREEVLSVSSWRWGMLKLRLQDGRRIRLQAYDPRTSGIGGLLALVFALALVLAHSHGAGMMLIVLGVGWVIFALWAAGVARATRPLWQLIDEWRVA